MLVKTAVGSLVAKLALGIGVATASVTAAGAAGVLPDPAQHAMASAVSAATPFALPDPATSILVARTGTPPSTTVSTLTDGSGEKAADDTGGTRAVNHGACVSAAAQTDSEPGSKGKTVSSVARSDCGKAATTTSTTVVPPSTSTSSTTSSTSVTTAVAGADTRGANSGKGNSGSNSAKGGQGNSGRN